MSCETVPVHAPASNENGSSSSAKIRYTAPRGIVAAFGLLRCSVPLLLSCAAVLAQTPDNPTVNRKMPASRASSAPVIDGDISDSAWRSAARTDKFYDEYTGVLAADQTQVWLCYDDDNIYVSFLCKDSSPDQIVAKQTKRGGDLSADDRFIFRINPFNTQRGEDESRFRVNPLGTQSASIAGGRAQKLEWEGEWESACRITQEGWQGELRIPWRILTLPASAGPVTLGLNFSRRLARLQMVSYWSNITSQERNELTGSWEGVILPAAQAPAADRLKLLPFTLLGQQQPGENTWRSGVDARYDFTSSQTLAATLNPDFSNVEGDVVSIDFSYSERLPGERRPFFSEGAEYFRLGGYHTSWFVPQRIRRIDAGLKAYGKWGESNNLGLLVTSDIGSRTDGVLRWRRQFSTSDDFTFGMIHRDEFGIRNNVYVNGSNLRRGNWFLSYNYGKSEDKAIGDGESFNASCYNSTTRTTFGSAFSSVSPNFAARDGFVPFTDIRGISHSFEYQNEYRDGPLLRAEFDAFYEDVNRFNGSHFTRSAGVGFNLDLKSQLALGLNYAEEKFEENQDRVLELEARYPNRDPQDYVSATWNLGRRESQDYDYKAYFLARRPAKNLQFTYSREELDLGGDRLTQDVLTLSYDFSAERVLSGRLVRSRGETNWYLSFRRSGYGGAEYFLIVGDPNSESFRDRYVLKLVWPIGS